MRAVAADSHDSIAGHDPDRRLGATVEVAYRPRLLGCGGADADRGARSDPGTLEQRVGVDDHVALGGAARDLCEPRARRGEADGDQEGGEDLLAVRSHRSSISQRAGPVVAESQ